MIKLKNFFFIFLTGFFFLPVYAEKTKYQLASIEYHLESTRKKAVENKILIDTERIFESESELLEYKNLLLQKFENTRAFEDVMITFKKINDVQGEDGVVKLLCSINAAESKHLLVVPYPKYDSNSGLTLKLKAKDTNFLGNLEELNLEMNAGKKDSELTEENDFYFGASLNFIIPFYSDLFNVYWINNYAFEYNLADSRPQFETETGLKVELPFKRLSLVFDYTQGLYRDFEYTAFTDELYGKTYLRFSVPVKLIESDNLGNLIYRPFSDFDFNYDKDRISNLNDDLSGGVLAAGQEIEIRKINWQGNFRNGYSFLAGHKYGYNFECNDYQYKIYSKIMLFKAFTYNAFQAKLNFNYSDKYRTKIGENLRGAADDQYYTGTKTKALKVPSSIVLNLDFPFHIITTDWTYWIETVFGKDSLLRKHFKWTDTFNFELQAVPFIDAALTENEVTGRTFSLKDGWYTGGIEFLVFPSKWKSVVVRASAGFDLGKLLIKEKYPDKIDYSWRDGAKSSEIYIGLGLLY